MSKVALFAPLPGGSSQPTRITPDLADVCIIDVVGETGKVPRLKVKSREASLASLCNAINFNRQGGRIVISAQKREDTVVVSVSDEGPGIRREH